MPPSPRHPPLTFPLCSRQGRDGLLHELQHGAFVNTKLIEPSKFKLLDCTVEILSCSFRLHPTIQHERIRVTTFTSDAEHCLSKPGIV